MKSKRKVLLILGWSDPRWLRSISRYAVAAGWHVETRSFFTGTIPRGWHGDGMIVGQTFRKDLSEFTRRQAPQQPTVIIGRNNPGIQAPMVTGDNAMAGRLAATHFLQRGHQQFAWFGNSLLTTAQERQQGYRETVEAAGHRCHLLNYTTIPELRQDLPNRSRWLAHQLRRLPKPLALFTLDDQMAAETIETCLEAGWRVPEDISVMGVGNIELACQCSPIPISSVDLDPGQVLWKAAELLDELMRGKRPPQEPVVIAPRAVVARQSTDSLAITHPQLVRALRFLKENIARSFGIEQMAEAASISCRKLYHLFQRQLRCSPAEFVIRQRMDMARHRMTETQAPFRAIATGCGFGTVRTFNRCFRRIEKMSPRTWRKRHLEQSKAVT